MSSARAARVARIGRALAPAAIYLGVLLLVYWQLWTPIAGARAAFRYDPRHEYWGDLIFQARSLAHGHLPLWNPFDRGGFPLYGDPQPGLLYPANWPLLAYGALSGAVPFALVLVKFLAHALFGALGMHYLVRRLGARAPGCYAAGLLFTLTSPKLRYGGSALNWSIAWVPWLLLATDWFAERPSPRRAIVLGSTFAMVLLAGAPAVLLYALLLAVPYGLYRLRGRLRAALGPLALAALVCAMWVAPLVAGNLEQLPASVRDQRDLGFIADSAFTPAHLVGFLVPRVSSENPYVGILPLLAAVLLLASPTRRRTALFLVLAALGVALSFGQSAGFLPALASAVPLFGLFRRAHRYLYVAQLALAIVAGLGIERALALEAAEQRRLARWITWVAGGVVALFALAYVVSVAWSPLEHPRSTAFALATASALVTGALFRGAVAWTGRARRAAGLALPIVLALDLWTANSAVIAEGMTPPPVPRHDALAAKLGDAATDVRIYDHHLLDFRAGTRLELRDFGGYEDDPLGLARYRDFREAAHKDPRLLGHAGVRYLLDGDHKLGLPAAAARRALAPDAYELLAVAPAVFYAPRPHPVSERAAALATLAPLPPGQDAVYEGPAPPAAPAGAAATAGRFTVYEPGRVVAEIDTPGPGLVVIGEAYFPAWRATVDGEAVAIQPANVMFRGVAVTAAGHHVIEMVLATPRFDALCVAYLLAWLLLVGALSGATVRRPWPHRRRTTTPPTAAGPTGSAPDGDRPTA